MLTGGAKSSLATASPATNTANDAQSKDEPVKKQKAPPPSNQSSNSKKSRSNQALKKKKKKKAKTP